jgi:hypothetical protein
VAGGRDAAGLGVAEIDPADVAVDGERRLARERVQHLAEVERRVQCAGGPDQRLVLLGARVRALLGLEARQAGGRLVGQHERGGDLGLAEVAARAEDRDRDVADLAAPRDRHEEQRDGAEAIDEVGADLRRVAGVDDVERRAGRDHALRPGRAAVERLDVARRLHAVGVHDVAVAAAGALGDLEQQHLVDGERLVEGRRQLGVERLRALRLGGRAGDPVHAGEATARAERLGGSCGGQGGGGERFGNGGPSLG